MAKIIKILQGVLLFLLLWQTRLIILPGNLNNGYFEYGSVSLYGTEILLWLIVALLVVKFFVDRRPVKASGTLSVPGPTLSVGGRKERVRIFAFLFLCFFAFLIMHPTDGVLNYSRLFLEGILLILIIRGAGTLSVPKAPLSGAGDRMKLAWAFIAGAALQACLGIWQFFSQSAFASKWLGMAAHDPSVLGTFVVEADFGRWLRAYGALPHPNILAGYLMAAILLLFFLPLVLAPRAGEGGEGGDGSRESSPFYKGGLRGIFFAISARVIGTAILFSLLFASLFFTFSRGAWIALAVGLIIFVFQRKLNRISLLGLWTGFITIVCLSILFWPLVSARTVADSRLEIKSTAERVSYYNEAWTLIKKHPWTGVGLGNYTRAIHDEIDSGRPAYGYQPVHNIFVLALAELGIFGILFIAAVLYFLRKVIPWKKTVCLLPFVVIGLFDHYLLTLYPGIMLWAVYLGLIL